MKKITSFTFVILLSIINVFSQTSWKGTTSTNWSTASNWTNGVPTSSIDVIIGDISFTGAFQPILTGGTSYCKNLTIGNSTKVSSLSIDKNLSIKGNLIIGANGTINAPSNNRSITIAGNWTNNGTYNATSTSASVVFSGTTQTITGNTTFKDLKVNSSTTLTLNSSIVVNDEFKIYGTFKPTVNYAVSGTASYNIYSSGKLYVEATNFSDNYSLSGTKTFNKSSTVNYSSAVITQYVTNTITYGTLRISGGSTKYLSGNLPNLNSSNNSYGRIYIDAGTLDLQSYTANRGTPSGGYFVISANCTLRIGGTNGFPANFNTKTIASTSTVEYYGNNQTILATTYGNLMFTGTSGAVIKTMPTTALVVAGNFSANIGTATSLAFTAANTLEFKKSMTLGSGCTFNAGSYTHTSRGNWINNGIFNGGTSTIALRGVGSNLSGTGTNNFYNITVYAAGITADSNFSISASGNITTSGSGAFQHLTGGTISLSGTKTIGGNGFKLSNIIINGTRTTTANITVDGNFSVDGTFTASGGVLTLNGNTKVIDGAGTITFRSLNIFGTITTARDFSLTSNLTVALSASFSATNGVTYFNGYTTFNGTANLYNVTINSGKTLRMATSSLLGISSVFTKTGTLNVTTYKPNTIKYNSTGNQNIIGTTYDNLILAEGGTKTATGAITVNTDFTINPSVSFNASSYIFSLYRHFINNGTFTASTSNVQLLGTNSATITGETTFNTFTLNKSSANIIVTLDNNVIATNIIATQGKIKTGINSITTTGGRSGNGIIIGTIIHNHSFTNGVTYYFEGPQNGITFSSPSVDLTSVSLKVTPYEIPDFDPAREAILREYEIQIPTGTYTNATLRFHYEDNELNAFDEPFLAIYKHNTGIVWDSIGYTSRNTTTNYVEQTGLTTITGRFAFSGRRNIIEWNGSVSSAWENAANWTTVSGSDMSNRVPTNTDAARIGNIAFTNQPSINSNQSVNILRFGSTQAATLTINSGSLTNLGSIKGVWSTDRTHTIDIGASALTVGIDFYLSDGTNNHNIDLTIGSGLVTINNDLIQNSNSNITFSGAGNLTLNGSYNYSLGNFTAGTGTVTYSGNFNQIVANVTYNNLSFTKSSEKAQIVLPTVVNGNFLTSTGGEISIEDSLTVLGNITIGASTDLIDGNAIISIAGNWLNNGNFLVNDGTVVFNGANNQTTNSSIFNTIIVSKSSNTLSLTDSVYVNSNLSIASGTVNLGTYKLERTSPGGTLSMSSGTTLLVGGDDNFPANFTTNTLDTSSTVVYNGTLAQNILPLSYGNLTTSNGGSNTKNISNSIVLKGNLLIDSGSSLFVDSVSVSCYGNITNNGSIDPTSSTFIFEGISKNITGPITLNNINVNGSYTVLSGTTNLTGNMFIESTGSLNFGNNMVILDGDLTNKGSLTSSGTATFSGTREQTIQLLNAISSTSTGIINFNGSVSPILNSTSSPTFATVNINNTGGVVASVPWNVVVAMNIDAAATFDGGPLTHNFYRNFTNNGTVYSSGVLNFSPGAPFSASGTVQLDGIYFESNGDVVFGGTAPLTLVTNSPILNNVIISNTHVNGVTAPNSWNIGNELSIVANSTFKAGTGTTHIISNSITNNGTLDGQTSTISFNGAGNYINGLGTTNFNHLKIEVGAQLQINKSINISENFINDGIFDGNGRTVSFIGSNPSIISGLSGSVTFGDLEINKTTSTVTLQIPINVTDNFTLTEGLINTTLTNILTLEDNAISSSGTNTSFVNGPMKKIGDDVFEFPVGKGTVWARLGISAPSLVTDAYTVQYFDTNYVDTTTMAVAPTPVLNNVSRNEYWTCDRVAGSSDVSVQLFWENAARSGIDAYTSDLVVARWNGTAWENAGQSAITTSNPGNVTSNTVTSFSPFTFGSLSPGANTLPIELLSFEAKPTNSFIDINWETTTEINNEFFEIEKSTNATTFELVKRLKGAGNSNTNLSYNTKDENPFKGISYYRLKQIDFDGNYTYSSIVSVNYSPNEINFTVYPNPNNGELININVPDDSQTYQLIISDTKGHKVYSEIIAASNQLAIKPNDKLKSGLYIISLIGEKNTVSQKLIISQALKSYF